MLSLDKGVGDEVRVGQAVLDSRGLVGQVVEAGLASSRVLMITDLSHSTPVQVLRNDYRAILRGTGEPARLLLQHVPDTADIREGDLLITSGLGGRFPSGYPVAVVRSVVHDPAEPFALIVAEPTAQLARSRHLVVVTESGRAPTLPDPAEGTAVDGETAP
jgi:rod shape-determining protein MreC